MTNDADKPGPDERVKEPPRDREPADSGIAQLIAKGEGTPSGGDVVPVIGIGASAGGLKVLQRFFDAMPPRSGLVFVVILHLSPEHESGVPGVLRRSTQMPVTQARR